MPSLTHLRRPAVVALAILALVALAGCGKSSSATKLRASMSGGAEVPGPGNDNASGIATVTPEPEKDRVCFDLKVNGVASPTAAHIHRGVKGQKGDIVVALDPPANGSSKGCKPTDRALAKEIADKPGDFYVNVHNAQFPNGAVRGQLSK